MRTTTEDSRTEAHLRSRSWRAPSSTKKSRTAGNGPDSRTGTALATAAERLGLDLYELDSIVSADAGWLRMLRLEWNGRTLGMDLNWHFGTTQHSGQWVFDVEYFSRSPGQILLRHSVLLALESGMQTYDLGLGDQAYKFRLPSRTVTCPTWGLYPPE